MNGNLNKQSLTIGKLFGIKIRFHVSWLVIFTLVAWTVISGYLPTYYSGLSLQIRIIDGIVITVLFFASVLAHELAHSLTARRYGIKIQRITLFLFGGAAELQQEPTNAKAELMMTIAGPLTSLAAALFFGAIWLIGIRLHVQAIEIIAGIVAVLNLSVGVFNLIPAYPLDGGRIFRALMWLKTQDIVSATRAASYLSYALSYLLITVGVLEFFSGGFINGLWAVLLGFFLHQLTRVGYRQTVEQKQLAGLKVADIMEADFLSVPSDTTVEEYLNHYLLIRKQYDCLVMDGDTVVGILSATRAMSVSDPQMSIVKIMVRVNSRMLLGLNDSALRAVQIMERYNVHILPVYREHQLAGTVTLGQIGEYLRLRQALSQKTLPKMQKDIKHAT